MNNKKPDSEPELVFWLFKSVNDEDEYNWDKAEPARLDADTAAGNECGNAAPVSPSRWSKLIPRQWSSAATEGAGDACIHTHQLKGGESTQ